MDIVFDKFIGKNVSILEILINCKKQWEYLALTGSANKEDYFLENALNVPACRCYCCEFFLCNPCCDACPLIGYAWGITGAPVSCEKSECSCYCEWWESKSIEDRKFWASKMVVACDSAIRDRNNK